MRILLALVLAAMTLVPILAMAAPVKDGVDEGVVALEHMTDAQRAYSETLARANGSRPEDVAQLRQLGYSWDDAGQGAALASGWDLRLSQISSANMAGHSWGDIHEAAKLAAWSGFSFETVLALKESGMSWKEVAAQVKVDGVDLRDAPRDPNPPKKKAVPAKKKVIKKAPGVRPGA